GAGEIAPAPDPRHLPPPPAPRSGIGASTSRLPVGHHGANHPVQDLRTGKVAITSQNHEFQVDESSIPRDSGFRVSSRNLNDGSVEGLVHDRLPIRTCQYHPAGAPGPPGN